MLFLSQVTWYDAQKYCEQLGMQMTMLKTSKELAQVEAPLEQTGKSILNKSNWCGNYQLFFAESSWFWLSASDIGRTPHGQFEWADGSPVPRDAWARQEPGDAAAGQETCVYFLPGDNKLYDNRCSGTSGILCELPVMPNACK